MSLILTWHFDFSHFPIAVMKIAKTKRDAYKHGCLRREKKCHLKRKLIFATYHDWIKYRCLFTVLHKHEHLHKQIGEFSNWCKCYLMSLCPGNNIIIDNIKIYVLCKCLLIHSFIRQLLWLASDKTFFIQKIRIILPQFHDSDSSISSAVPYL